MAAKNNSTKTKKGKSMSGGGVGAFYCLGFIGAVVYYIQQTDTFWEIVLAVLKAVVWPAFMVYDLLGFLTL